jgi:hypothetical protein
MEGRQLKSRPKLVDVLEHFRNLPNQKNKAAIILKVLYSFGKTNLIIEKDWTDLKFEKIQSLILRVERMLNINVPTINNLITKVDSL